MNSNMRGPRKRYHAADRIAGANLEAGNRFASLGNHRFLTGNLGQIANGVVEHFLVGNRLADTHVERYLGDAGHFHSRLVPELLGQLGTTVVL
jgi:hypothetical protein